MPQKQLAGNDVHDLVERARAGDQVAMGIIARVRDLSAAKDARARVSFDAIQSYIKRNPPSRVGSEPSVNTNPQALSAMWQARSWSPDAFAAMVARAAPFVKLWEGVVVVAHGPPITIDCPIGKAASMRCSSKLANIARGGLRLQRLRDPKYPISKFCPQVGWELGE